MTIHYSPLLLTHGPFPHLPFSQTTLGLIASTALSRRFIDADSVFKTVTSQSVAEFVRANGWPAFRAKESSILRSILNRYPRDAVISCGGGIVESSEAREFLRASRATSPVILVLREKEEVLKGLVEASNASNPDGNLNPVSSHSHATGSGLGTGSVEANNGTYTSEANAEQRPDWGEAVRDVWRRREPWFWECASHVFVSLTAQSSSASLVQGGIISKESAGTSHSNPISGSTTPNPNAQQTNPHQASSATTTSRRLPTHPLALKAVEQSFLRLIRFILSDPEARKPMLSRSPTPTPSRPTSPTSHKPSSFSHKAPTSSSHSLISKFNLRMPGPPEVTSRSSLLSTSSSFLSLAFPDLRDVQIKTFSKVIEGVDCIEIRADLLDCLKPASTSYRLAEMAALKPNCALAPPVIDFSELALQIETLRLHSRGLPILFTVRSQREGGAFHDDRDHKAGSMKSLHSEYLYFKLLDLALKMGVELLDIEMAWSSSMVQSLLSRRGRTRAKLSYHDLSGIFRWDSNHSIALYERANNFGADLVGLYGTAKEEKEEQNWHLLSFQAKVLNNARLDKKRKLPPLVAINMGDQGKTTRTFNPCLTPVAHPAQPALAAPGQMSVKDIGRARSGLGFGKLSRFYVLFGEEREEREVEETAESSGSQNFNISTDLVKDSLEAGVLVLGLPHSVRFLPESSAFVLRHSEALEEATSKESSSSQPLSLPLEFSSEQFGGAFLGGSATSRLQTRLKGKLITNLGAVGGDSDRIEDISTEVQESGYLPSTRDSDLVGAVDLIVRLEDDGNSLASTSTSIAALKSYNLKGGLIPSSSSHSQFHSSTQNQHSSSNSSAAHPAGLHAALTALGNSDSPSNNKSISNNNSNGISSPSTPNKCSSSTNSSNSQFLLADHTLPKAIERVVCSHLSPINAPGPTSSALVLILDRPRSSASNRKGKARAETGIEVEVEGEESEEVKQDEYDSATKIATKSAVVAISRLGFGKCVVVEMEDQRGSEGGKKGEANQTSTSSWVHPTSGEHNSTEDPSEMDWWANSLTHSIWEESIKRESWTSKHPQHQASSGFADLSHPNPVVPTHNQAGGDPTYRCQPFSLKSKSLEDLPKGLLSVFNREPIATEGATPTLKVGRPASTIFLIGGSEESRSRAIKFLDSPPDSRETSEKPANNEADSEMKDGEKGVPNQDPSKEHSEPSLPSELWDSLMGGVILSIPCSSRSTSTSTSNLSQNQAFSPSKNQPRPSISFPSSSNTPNLNQNPSANFNSNLTPSLHRNGWLVLPNKLLELERLTRGVFEPWMRKRAPRASMGRSLGG